MTNRLLQILKKEDSALRMLLILLEKQYKMIMDKDIFGLEGIVEEIKLCNREIAEVEVERRQLLGQNSIKEFVEYSKDRELDQVYRNLQKLLQEITLQKDTNELLIKQQLSFTNRLLNLINPRREVPVYNSYGNIKR
ncbi:flagellar protein FlgN [Clostridium carnis]